MSLGLVHALAMRRASRAPLVQLLGQVRVSPVPLASPPPDDVSHAEARLLALLALRPGETDRRTVGGTLWPEVDDARAAGNLRSTLWRLAARPTPLLTVTRTSVALLAEVNVDVHLLGDWAARMISATFTAADLAQVPWDIVGVEMLPGWHDDWIVLERERLRQRLLHGLELMSASLLDGGRHAEAVEVALIVVRADGLRESGQRALISAHLAEGNWAEARRCYREHRDLLATELGVAPSAALAALVGIADHRVPAAVR